MHKVGLWLPKIKHAIRLKPVHGGVRERFDADILHAGRLVDIGSRSKGATTKSQD
jgi:hypothetical protein